MKIIKRTGGSVTASAVRSALAEDVAASHAALEASTTGGANKLAKYAADGTITTGTLLPDATPGTYAHDGAGNYIFPDARGLVGKTAEGSVLWNMYFSDAHDAGGGELYVSSRNRICFNWGGSSGDGGFQLGTLGRSKEWIYSQVHGTGTAGDQIRESKAYVWRGNHYNAGTPLNAWIGSQYVPTSGSAGYLKFNHIAGDTPVDSNGRLNGTNVFNISETGPVLPSSMTFKADGDFTLTQNSVPVLRSDFTSAVTNTIRLGNGYVRVGNSGATSAPVVPFEVRNASDAAATNTTVGSFYIDSNGTARVGRLADSDTNGRLIVQNRVGTASFEVNASTGTHTISGTFNNSAVNNFTNTTDATSTSTGAAKFYGGVGIAKKLFVGTGLNVAAPTVPASSGAAGTAGDISWDADYIYVCVATNTWKRSAIATW